MPDELKKLFYVRIDFVDLMDFATDPEGENMTLLTFAKELKKGHSDIPQIQHIINEAHCYYRQKKEAGILSAKKRAEKAKKEREAAEKAAKEQSNGVATEVNDVEQRSNGVATEVNGPPTNSSNNTTRDRITSQVQNLICGDGIPVGRKRRVTRENGKQFDFDTGEELCPFDEGYLVENENDEAH